MLLNVYLEIWFAPKRLISGLGEPFFALAIDRNRNPFARILPGGPKHASFSRRTRNENRGSTVALSSHHDVPLLSPAPTVFRQP